MYLELLTKVSFGAEFPSTSEAEYTASLALLVAVMIVLLIYVMQGNLGVGRLGN